MNQQSQNQQHPILFAWQNLVKKFYQHPGIYPIRYYKKANRFKRTKFDSFG